MWEAEYFFQLTGWNSIPIQIIILNLYSCVEIFSIKLWIIKGVQRDSPSHSDLAGNGKPCIIIIIIFFISIVNSIEGNQLLNNDVKSRIFTNKLAGKGNNVLPITLSYWFVSNKMSLGNMVKKLQFHISVYTFLKFVKNSSEFIIYFG